MANLPPYTTLQDGKYLIMRYLSSGGFGYTYEAKHVMIDKRVAIKEFFVKDFCNRDKSTNRITTGILNKQPLVDKLRQKFIAEAEALFEMHHPGIVRVTDVFEENGTAYFVMDYIDGYSMQELLKSNGPISEMRLIRYVRQVAKALDYVHQHNRLHLDIKPANIMINDRDEAVLIDFGTSKQYDEVGGENTSTLMGMTPGYAPLEQMGNNVTKFTPSTDIYALGATMYALLSGKQPPHASMLATGDTLPPLPDNISQSTRHAIARAMEINRNARPQSIREFMQMLNICLEDEAEKPMTPQIEKVTETDDYYEEPSSRMSRYIRPILISLLVALLGVGAYFIFFTKEEAGNKFGTVINKTFTDSDGNSFIYTGEVNKDGRPHGTGSGKYQHGQYQGQYVDGLRSGHGVYDCKGNHFEGTYANDQYAEGTLTITEDGSYFVGTFKDNNFNDGKWYSKSGKEKGEMEGGEWKK